MNKKFSYLLFACLLLEIRAYADLELYEVYSEYSLVVKASDLYLDNSSVGFTNQQGDSMSYEVCDLMFRYNLCAMCLENDSPYPKDKNPDLRLEELRTGIRKREGEFIIHLIFFKDYRSVFRVGIDYINRLDNLRASRRSEELQQWLTNAEFGEKEISDVMLEFFTNRKQVLAELKSIEMDNTPWDKAELNPNSQIVIGLPEYNYLYRGLKTKIEFNVSNVNQTELGIRVRNGNYTIENNEYFVVAGAEKECGIYLYKVSEDDSTLLGSKVFRVKPVPDPVITLSSDGNCKEVSKLYLNDFKGLSLAMLGFDFYFTWKVLGYTCKIEKSGSIEQIVVIGPAFSEELLLGFKNLQTGDKVHFMDVTVVGSNEEIRKLKDVVLHIVN